jgi:hypothetical protein
VATLVSVGAGIPGKVGNPLALDYSTVALSLATNLFATLLIAYKLWSVNVVPMSLLMIAYDCQ